jgi:DNA repair exonuclease SbcCD ATPase subunit
MSTPLADQLKPLLQRLLTMAESHDERLARLEAAHSRLGTQIARIGEQLTRQSEQLSRLEETPVPAPAPIAAPATVMVRPSGVSDAGTGARFNEQFGRLNEQITRVREQFGRMTDQLSRIEHAQTDLREEAIRQGGEQLRLLERVETNLVRRQEQLAEALPEQLQQRIEQVLTFAVPEEGEDLPAAEVVAERAEEQVVETAVAPAHLATVQEEVRQLNDRITELVAQLGKLGNAPPSAPVPVPASAPSPGPAAVPASAVAPALAPTAAAKPAIKPVTVRPVAVVRPATGNRQASR